MGLSHLRRWAIGKNRTEQTTRARVREQGHGRMQASRLAVLSVGEVPVRWYGGGATWQAFNVE